MLSCPRYRSSTSLPPPKVHPLLSLLLFGSNLTSRLSSGYRILSFDRAHVGTGCAALPVQSGDPPGTEWRSSAVPLALAGAFGPPRPEAPRLFQGTCRFAMAFSSFPPSFYPLDKMLLERRLQKRWDRRARSSGSDPQPSKGDPAFPTSSCSSSGWFFSPTPPARSQHPKNRAATTDGPCQRRYRRGAQRFGLRPGSQTLPGYPVPAASPRLPITQFLVRLCTSLCVSITEAVRRGGGEDLKPVVYERYLIATS